MRSVSPDEVEQLVRYSLTIANQGNVAGARTIVRALARQHPDHVRVWIWLSHWAETPAEQYTALERALELDPDHQESRQRLQQLHARLTAQAASSVSSPHDSSPATHTKPEKPRPQIVLVLAGMLILLLVIGISISTSTLSLSFLTSFTQPSRPAALPALPVLPIGTKPPTAMPSPTRQPRPTPTLLPSGTLIEEDGWYVMLVRPSHTQVISGPVGERHPQGHFVLVVLTVGNRTGTERRIPPGLFTLTDAENATYTPVPGASRDYLNEYGRGVRGDRALDETLPPGGILQSIPLLFDVPPDARDLLLSVVGREREGWAIPNTMTEFSTPVPWSKYHDYP